MKNIDKIIRENVDFFNSDEPFEGHFERFTAKLKSRQFIAPKRVSITPHLLKAAVVTVLVALSSLWTWEHVLSPDARRTSLSEVSADYAEVENYYVKEVNLMEDEIQGIWLNGQTGDNEMLIDELNKMDKTYEELQKDLHANPNDERIINAMIEHYQKKIEVMNFILSQLKEIQNQNENQVNNENYETVRL